MKSIPEASSSCIYSGARIFDGEQTLLDHAILVEDGRISGVLPRHAVPHGIPRRHAPDCTILPGLIDAHIHFMRWQGPHYLAFGVTTVRDTGNHLRWILERRDEWERHPWPRILCTGPLLDGPVPVHEAVARRCADSADAVAAVRETAAAGVDGIKLYVGLDPQWLAPMIQAGHAARLKVSMHCAGSVIRAGQAGLDEFFHLDGILADAWPDNPGGWLSAWGLPEFSRCWDRQREVADTLRDLGLTATPTLAYWDSQWRGRTPEHLQSEELRPVPREILRTQIYEPPNPLASAQWRRALEAAQRFVGLLLERRVRVLAGTDVPCGAVPPGLSLWRELRLLVDAGMSPERALRAATSDAAGFLSRPDLGHLRTGAAADLVLVRGNPLDRIPERPDIALVVRNGQPHTPAELAAAADPADVSLQDEPWVAQFEIHSKRRLASQQARKPSAPQPEPTSGKEHA